MPTIPVSLIQLGTLSTAVVTLLTALLTRVLPWARAKIDSRSVEKHLGTEVNAERSIRYYIRPRCQNLDPAGSEEPRLIVGVTQKLFEKLDEVLGSESEYRYIILLADSGMGKSSALINYCARHLRKFKKPYTVALVPLGVADTDQRIKDIEDKRSTVLFLDALDEDVLAITDHAERLHLLLQATRDFRRVLITCRTQFFAKDEEIPAKTGIIRVGARGANEPAEYYFHKLYLSPFNDQEINLYIRRRYPFWEPQKRKLARDMVQKIPNLGVRPMLLSHIDLLITMDKKISYSFELYEEMVSAWLMREKGFADPYALRIFSEQLAVALYVNRDSRGSERAGKVEVEALAKEWGIDLDSWQLTGRSLLNRDAEGSYKFAHRSIMEFLFIKQYIAGDARCGLVPWTDQMAQFYIEYTMSICDQIMMLPMGEIYNPGSFIATLKESVGASAYVRSHTGNIMRAFLPKTNDYNSLGRLTSIISLLVRSLTHEPVLTRSIVRGPAGRLLENGIVSGAQGVYRLSRASEFHRAFTVTTKLNMDWGVTIRFDFYSRSAGEAVAIGIERLLGPFIEHQSRVSRSAPSFNDY